MANPYGCESKRWNTKESFQDKQSRKFVIRMFDETFKIKLKNGTKTGIDLLYIDSKIKGGVEIEHGGWEGNLWDNNNYALQSGFNFRTVNIPERKQDYWYEWFLGHLTPTQLANRHLDKNIFVRTNSDFSQVIIIRPEVIRDLDKTHRKRFWCANTHQVEPFLCYKEVDVETYNLISCKYILK